jgi:hypothetical protein
MTSCASAGAQSSSVHGASRARGPAASNALLFGWTGAAHGQKYNSTYLEGWQQDLANFLLIRGPYAWLGYGWQGLSADYFMPDLVWELDVGEPEGRCAEASPGIFQRSYSKVVVSMNCSSWQPSILSRETGEERLHERRAY